MFDIDILTELIVHYHRHKSPIDNFRWWWKDFLTTEISDQSEGCDNSKDHV